MKRFCAECGREADVYYDNLCIDCFKKHNPLVEKLPLIKVSVCRECGSILYLNRWIRPRESLDDIVADIVKKEIRRHAKVEVKEITVLISSRNKNKYITIVRIKGRPKQNMPYYSEEHIVEVRMRTDLCPVCRDLILKKEKAILQIRASGRELSPQEKSEIIQIVKREIIKLQKKQRDAVIVDIEEERGIDIKLLSANVARALAAAIQREFPSFIKETYKLIRLDRNGRPVSKVTVKVELPPFSIGDIIAINNEIFYVKEIKHSVIKLVNLSNYKEISLTSKSIPRHIRRISVVKQKFLVNSITPPLISLLNLENYETIEIRLMHVPQWLKPGEIIEAAIYERRIYIIPPSE
ncbi:MAG: hypothetical protein DRJ52_05470 [Thermoprotei archaeon]|nr:MAG: hypothetical protein DRJ52_05470 [Thermoprotei archaeon]RLE98472.1 MAG: hypothetical protein DRJ63_07690 [Thermoprotei archaeon]